MRLTLAIAALSFSLSAHADLVYRSDSLTLILTEAKCSNAAVLGQIKPEYHGRFLQGMATMAGRPVSLCWTGMEDGTVVVIDEDGDSGSIPVAAFKPESAV